MTEDAQLERALRAALDDEFKARATYRKVLEAFGPVLPFANILASEERHILALRLLFDRYDVAVPDDPWPAKVSAPASLTAACEAGVAAERENAGLYAELLAATRDYPDVQATFRRLLAASQDNHLPAFARCAARERSGERGRRACGGGHGRRRRHRGGCAPRAHTTQPPHEAPDPRERS